MTDIATISFNVLLLAGGRSSRMGGEDKALKSYQDKPMIEHITAKLPQDRVNRLVISCNRNFEKYKRYSDALVSDHSYPNIEPFAGPLLGILSAMDAYPDDHWLILPCDTPDISSEIIERLIHAYEQSSALVSCLAVEGKLQPLHCLLSSSVRDSIVEFLSVGKRRAQEWIRSHEPLVVDCSDKSESLKNINAPSDLC